MREKALVAMRPIVRAELVNEPFGDPGLLLDFLFEKRALLVDLGDLHALASRKLLRVSDVFVTHAHMDHFSGFDRLLRVTLGRDKRLALFGPPGIADRVEHKLQGYTWNLVRNFEADLAIEVSEVGEAGTERFRFRCRAEFAREAVDASASGDGVLVDEPAFRVRAAVLDHGIPCLAYAFEETRHVNVMKDRLAALGLAVGPWLKDLKDAVIGGAPDDVPVRAEAREGAARTYPLGELRERVLRVVPGARLAYVTDVRAHEENAARIVALARGADTLFIEAPFLEADADIAARKNHLTAAQAGRLARRAGVAKLVPFHFSPRYAGREDEIRREAEAAFAG